MTNKATQSAKTQKTGIPAGWREVKLGDVAEEIIDNRGRNPSYYVENGVPVIDNFLITGEREVYLQNAKRFIDEEIFDNFIRKHIQHGDVLITLVGNGYGNVAIAPKEKSVIIQNTIGLRTNNPITNTFLFYWLSVNKISVLNLDRGAVQPSVKVGDLKELSILLPPLPEQKAIAEALSSLDDKIDLLHRQNKTLEDMAQALFRKWFVDEADEGWEEKSFVDFFDFIEGPGIRNWQYTESGTRFINIRLIQNGEIEIEKANFVSDQEANSKYKHFLLKEKDMIVSTSGTLGKTAIIRKYHLPLMLNTSVIRFRPKDGVNYSFVYQYLQSKQFREDLENYGGGSVQKNFGPTHLRMMKFRLPPAKLLENFRRHTDDLYLKLDKNYSQIRTLENLRDTLLPKLMSGEVRMKFNRQDI